jgi:predicted SAM-dependent methyltransferase
MPEKVTLDETAIAFANSDPRRPSLIARLSAREFEFNLSVPQSVYYRLERNLCHFLFRRNPPAPKNPNLLNLGCGPHTYPNWVNADDYAPKRRLRERDFKPNWTLDITRPWRCADDYWDGIFTQHVLEHVTYAEAVDIFKECFRTLKPGAWIRICVPDLATYVRYYRHEIDEEQFFPLPHRTLALSFLTQMHMHRSVWDADLMMSVLGEIGFGHTSPVAFGQGSDKRLIRDDASKAKESLYVEARRPTT